MDSRRSPGKQKRTKSERQDCIDSLGVLSSFYGKKKEQPSQKKKDPESDYAASLLVGRTFQYVTRKGERKNYVIRSYLPWNGTHRVQRCGNNQRDREYKTKVVDLEELPNIRWLDVDENDANIHTILPIDVYISNDPNVEETTEERKRKRDHQVVSPPMKKKCLQVSPIQKKSEEAKDLMASPPSSPPRMDPSQARSRKKRSARTTKEINTTTTTTTPTTTNGQTPENRDASVLESNQIPPLPNFTRKISDSSDSVAQDERKEKKSTRSSAYNGVYFVSHLANRKSPWRALCHRKSFLCSHGKPGIGSFKTEIDAARAYDDAIREHLKEVKRLQLLNFPTPAEKMELARSGLIAKRSWVEKKESTAIKTPAAKSSLVESKAPQRTKPPRGEASKPSSESRRLSKLSEGDRIAFELSGEENVHFGTVTNCGIGDYGQDQIWTISLDIGEICELDSGDVTEGLELYEKILENEKFHPLPKKASPSIGDRTAFGFGVSGIHFGCIKNRVREKGDHGKEHQKWTVEFDDGEVHKFDTSEMNNGLELYRRIREGKEARSLLGVDPPPDETASGDDHDQKKRPTVPTRQLLGMARGDRIAFDFGTEVGVYFGSIEQSDASCSKKRKDWWWDIAFDDGDRYKFDAFEMARGVALYAKIRESERNDPKFEEKVRQLEKEHLAEKKMVESRLSKEAKNRFLEVGFARWGKTYLPVLFLGPYHVGPGSVREQWLDDFSKVGGKGKTPQIVYWFGVAPDKGFSVLEESDCLSLAEGKKQGLLRMKDTKSKTAEKRNHALHKLKECHYKPKESRHPLGKVREVHERVWGPNPDRLLAEFEAAKEHGWSGWVSE